MSSLTFTGTAGSAYSTPSGWTAYGDALKYATSNSMSNSSFEFSQLMANDTLSDVVTITTVINCDISGWGEVGAAVLNSSLSGFNVFFRPDQDQLWVREQIAGSSSDTIDVATSIGLTTGSHTVVLVYNPTTNAVTVSLDGVPKLSGTYAGGATGLKAGVQLDNAFGGGVYQAFTSIDVSVAGAGGSYSIDTIGTGAVVRSGSTANPITTTNLGTLTSLTVAGIAATSLSATGGDGTFDFPALTAGGVTALYGSGKTAVAGDGSRTASLTTVAFLPNASQDYVTLSGTLNTSSTGCLYLMDPPAVVGDQIVFPIGDSCDAQGNYRTDTAGTRTLWHIEAATGISRSFTFTVDTNAYPPLFFGANF